MGNKSPSAIEQDKAKKYQIEQKASQKSKAELDELTRVNSIQDSIQN